MDEDPRPPLGVRLVGVWLLLSGLFTLGAGGVWLLAVTVLGAVVTIFFKDARPPGPLEMALHALVAVAAAAGIWLAAVLMWRRWWSGLLVAPACALVFAGVYGDFFDPNLALIAVAAASAPILALVDPGVRRWLTPVRRV